MGQKYCLKHKPIVWYYQRKVKTMNSLKIITNFALIWAVIIAFIGCSWLAAPTITSAETPAQSNLVPHSLIRRDMPWRNMPLRFTKLNTDEQIDLNPDDIADLAYAIWGEAGVVHDTTQRAAIAWVILNRVDETSREGMGRWNTIHEVVTAPGQIQGYWRHLGEPIPEEYAKLAQDVLTRYYQEKTGKVNVGRVIPQEYLFWKGDHVSQNYFTIDFSEGNLEWAQAHAWDWSLPSPY